MANILIVEDERPINNLLCKSLTLVGHCCTGAHDGSEGMRLIEENGYDILLLDIMLPGMSGYEIMRQRHCRETPVILITAKSGLTDKVLGLDSGADDYIVKPFEVLEVVSRVNAVLRRARRYGDSYSLDDARVDFGARKAFFQDGQVDLTPQEFSLLEALVINRNLALSRDKLLSLAWGYDYSGDTRTVDVHVQKLRKKLGLEERIKTVYKIGYRLETQ